VGVIIQQLNDRLRGTSFPGCAQRIRVSRPCRATSLRVSLHQNLYSYPQRWSLVVSVMPRPCHSAVPTGLPGSFISKKSIFEAALHHQEWGRTGIRAPSRACRHLPSAQAPMPTENDRAARAHTITERLQQETCPSPEHAVMKLGKHFSPHISMRPFAVKRAFLLTKALHSS
jgi:hypothetical protein